MYPIKDLEGIERIESKSRDKHVVLLLFVKPSDNNADDYISKINYWNAKSGKYCNIYLVGYSEYLSAKYDDAIIVSRFKDKDIEFSDTCFIEITDHMRTRLKHWIYSGSPELIVLQNKMNNYNSSLDFSAYNYIDIEYGLNKGYIDSFPRFMERLLNASKSEVESKSLMRKATILRIKPRNVIEQAILECENLPKSVRYILADRLFYKTSYK